MDRDVYIYALSRVFDMKPYLGRRLVENFENLSDLFEMKECDLIELFGGNMELAGRLRAGGLLEKSYREMMWADSKGVSLLFYDDDRYPKLLKECEDAPMLLFYIGNAEINAHLPVSIVGTRLASSYGKETCYRLVEELAVNNTLVVSGMAYGIDACAHRAAIDYELPTIGVLPCGIDTIYPEAHREIAKKMVENGGIITEFPPGCGVRKWHFLKRNRIIAGMSEYTVVVESRLRGGAMRTAEYANSYNREVYAVPGRLYDTNSIGCNYLISRNMAQICIGGTISAAINSSKKEGPSSSLHQSLFLFDSDKKEKILLSLKNNSVQDADSLSRTTGLSAGELAQVLLELELEGSISGDKWGRYSLSGNC